MQKLSELYSTTPIDHTRQTIASSLSHINPLHWRDPSGGFVLLGSEMGMGGRRSCTRFKNWNRLPERPARPHELACTRGAQGSTIFNISIILLFYNTYFTLYSASPERIIVLSLRTSNTTTHEPPPRILYHRRCGSVQACEE